MANASLVYKLRNQLTRSKIDRYALLPSHEYDTRNHDRFVKPTPKSTYYFCVSGGKVREFDAGLCLLRASCKPVGPAWYIPSHEETISVKHIGWTRGWYLTITGSILLQLIVRRSVHGSSCGTGWGRGRGNDTERLCIAMRDPSIHTTSRLLPGGPAAPPALYCTVLQCSAEPWLPLKGLDLR